MLWSLLLLGLSAVANASQLTLQSPRFTVTSSGGAQLQSDIIATGKPLSTVTVGPKDTLKLTFQVTDRVGGSGVQPHQTFLRFYDEASGEEGIQPVKVTSAGKAKFELNMARPPSSLPPTTTEPLKVSLILGSFTHAPAKYDLFELNLPASHPAPQHPDEASFHPLPSIVHTFRPEQKIPPRIISAAFAAAVLAPWLVLVGLWSQVGLRAPHLFSLSVLPFTVSLGAFEALLLWYWIDLRLGQVLLYGAMLTPVTAYTGKIALVAASEWRLGKK